MKRNLAILTFTLSWLALPITPDASAQPMDRMSHADGHELVDQLVEQLGGREAWDKSSAVRMTHVSHMPHMSSDLNWMVGHEVIEHATMRAYGEHPLWNSRIASDGTNAWGVNWKFPNSPKGMATIHYHMVFMPWLALSDHVRFGETGTGMLPEDEVEYRTISFRNVNGAGEAQGPTWYLYVHPDSGDWAGFSIDFGQARAWHRIDSYQDVNGLRLPADWVTYAGPQKQIIGYHVVSDIDLDYAFDPDRMNRPEDATDY